MISAIIPTYRNPEFLDLCLKSATENKLYPETDIIVIVDGFVEESVDVVSKYDGIRILSMPKNEGMQTAINLGVYQAETEWIFVVNDDNVFGPNWDQRLYECIDTGGYENTPLLPMTNYVYTMNQMEPSPSIYNFRIKDLGRTAAEFQYDEWMISEPKYAENRFDDSGRIFPFLMAKRWFMAVGGFDTIYKSPFWCDVDFWLKIELLDILHFRRYYGMHLYHFGSMATKNRDDDEAEKFKKSEMDAARLFRYKWGYVPNLVANTHRNNTKFPAGDEKPFNRGIPFADISTLGD